MHRLGFTVWLVDDGDQLVLIDTGYAGMGGPTTGRKESRTIIANHLGVSVARVTDEAHFTDDLGADWLDRLDLMIAVEDQFAGVEIRDDDVDR